ncbi:MAG: class I SAM-dependent methyltransferase [Burkholderiales bacterium]
MPAARFARRALALVLCSAALAFAQAPQTPSFEPSVGQEGKDVVWVPTPQALLEKMLDMARVTPRDFVMDLGSGDGRTVIAAARRGARALGIEYDADMVALSRRNAERARVAGRAAFRQADLFETDFSRATVITMFLLPSINLKLRPALLGLKLGTRIVSNTFTMDAWSRTRPQP